MCAEKNYKFVLLAFSIMTKLSKVYNTFAYTEYSNTNNNIYSLSSVSSGYVTLVRVYLLMWQWNEVGTKCAQTEFSNKINYIFYFAWFWRMGYVITSNAAGTGVVAEENFCKLHIQIIYWSYRMGQKPQAVTRKAVPVQCWGWPWDCASVFHLQAVSKTQIPHSYLTR